MESLSPMLYSGRNTHSSAWFNLPLHSCQNPLMFFGKCEQTNFFAYISFLLQAWYFINSTSQIEPKFTDIRKKVVKC